MVLSNKRVLWHPLICLAGNEQGLRRTKCRSWLPVMMDRPSGIHTMADTSELCALMTWRHVPANGSQMRSVVSVPATA